MNKTFWQYWSFCYLGNDAHFEQASTGYAEIDLRIAVAQNKYNHMSKITSRPQNKSISSECYGLHLSYLLMSILEH